ncbi:MAG: hypothetical protein GXO43_04040 [Crenarchaeota archaeon]|nr:hypothetical protein [Thermoproteota archaeon]
MKAISPVVATILIIGITIAAVAGLWMLVQRNARTGSVVKLDVVSIQANAAPDAKSCSFVVTLRNSGNVPVTVTKIVVSAGSGNNVVNTTLSPQNLRLSPGSTEDFTGVAKSQTPVFTDGSTAMIIVKYTGPDGSEHTIIQYATIRTSTF